MLMRFSGTMVEIRDLSLVIIAKTPVISPNFLVWKFCGKAQIPHSCGNCAFPQNFHTRKSGEITVFFAMDFNW